MLIERKAFRTLEEALAAPGPAILGIHGPPESGKSFALRHVAGALSTERPLLWLNGRDVPAPILDREWTRALARQAAGHPGGGAPTGNDAGESGADAEGPSQGPEGTWQSFLDVLRRQGGSPPPILVLDGADPVLRDRRLVEGLRRWWAGVRARGWQLHLVVVVRDAGALQALQGEGTAAPRPLPMGDLTLREVAREVPDWPAREVVETFAMVGGLPGYWSQVDGRLRAVTNLARLLLSAEAPLRTLPGRLLRGLEGDRSLAVLHALARGAVSWGEVRKMAGVFRTSSELGPYMKRLEDEGLVTVDRSLDAAPRSRSRRYRITRPLVDFWLGPGLASGHDVFAGATAAQVWSRLAPGDLGERLPRRLPDIAREYLSLHADERLPGTAREAGGLWGRGYDLPVSGTLATGAVVYGRIAWNTPSPDEIDRIVSDMRETRYGFGREARIPLLVTGGPPGHHVGRRAAQVAGSVVLTAEDLVGNRG